MKYVSEFRQATLRDGLIRAINELSRPLRIMEVCGGHTHAICKYGLASLLPPEVRFVHGPGCPVCIVPATTLARAAALADQPATTVACFGDIMRVPSPRGTLLSRARGTGRVRMVYSAMDSLNLATAAPAEQVVLFAIGFETTAPSTAAVLRRARSMGVGNLSVLSAHYLVPPALQAIMADPDTRVDAFIAPGHVSTIIGLEAYRLLCERWGCPVVVAGFEPLDILHGVLLILRQMKAGHAAVENQYRRAVRADGNPVARDVMAEVFTVVDASWRGLGVIGGSGLKISRDYASWDAEVRFGPWEDDSVEDLAGCRCGDVLRGLLLPSECALFGRRCTPDDPFGPCMVSAEGACAAYFHYGVNDAGS